MLKVIRLSNKLFFPYGIWRKGSRGLEGPCFSLHKVILF